MRINTEIIQKFMSANLLNFRMNFLSPKEAKLTQSCGGSEVPFGLDQKFI